MLPSGGVAGGIRKKGVSMPAGILGDATDGINQGMGGAPGLMSSDVDIVRVFSKYIQSNPLENGAQLVLRLPFVGFQEPACHADLT